MGHGTVESMARFIYIAARELSSPWTLFYMFHCLQEHSRGRKHAVVTIAFKEEIAGIHLAIEQYMDCLYAWKFVKY